MLTGIPVSKGISIGEAHILDRSKLCVLKQTIDSSDIDKEVIRFRKASDGTLVPVFPRDQGEQYLSNEHLNELIKENAERNAKFVKTAVEKFKNIIEAN